MSMVPPVPVLNTAVVRHADEVAVQAIPKVATQSVATITKRPVVPPDRGERSRNARGKRGSGCEENPPEESRGSTVNIEI